MHLPALRQRPADILPLAEHFIALYAPPATGIHLSTEAQGKMLGYLWPGNVRELQNVIQRALILCVGNEIGQNDLQFEEAVEPVESPLVNLVADAEPSETALEDNLKDAEQQLIIEALQQESGRRKEAAERLGISPRTLRYKLAKTARRWNCASRSNQGLNILECSWGQCEYGVKGPVSGMRN